MTAKEDTRPASLQWDVIEHAFGPECIVAWDRLVVAGVVTWEPVLRLRPNNKVGDVWPFTRLELPDHAWFNELRRLHDIYKTGAELWADEVDCLMRMQRLGREACRCMFWDGVKWCARIAAEDKGLARLRERNERNRRAVITDGDYDDRRDRARAQLALREVDELVENFARRLTTDDLRDV